ncbi:MAG: hypothetical protein PSX37_03205 [bacterium]|nr:hypothetical protein [bacterium]
MTRPVSLTIGVILQWVGAVIAIISGLDLIAAAFSMSRSGISEQLETTLREQGITDIAGSLLVLGVFLAGVSIVLLALLRILIAGYVWQGRNWARIVLTVLIGISIVGGIAYLFEGYVMRMLLTVPVDVLVLWLIFNKQSSAFIAERSAARAVESVDTA